MNTPQFEVLRTGDAEAGQRLDVFLAAHWKVSRARAQKLIENVRINGAMAKASHVLRAGDEIVLEKTETPALSTQAPPFDTARAVSTLPLPPILFEDEHILVLNKPAGLVVHPGAGEEQTTLVDVLRASGRALSGVGPPERAGIVHRLDKETSGVMVVCKTDAAHWKLAADFAERRVRKIYAALVCGVPAPRGRIEAPIARHPINRKKMAINATGRSAVTEYSVLRAWSQFALLNINLLTGRTHQIRVHLAYLQHPVAGDAVYGGLKRALQTAPDAATRAALEALCGQALHAAKLEFAHPVSGAEMSFETPLPEEMQHVIAALDAA